MLKKSYGWLFLREGGSADRNLGNAQDESYLKDKKVQQNGLNFSV